MPFLRRHRNLRIERPASRIGAIVRDLDVKALCTDEWRTLYRAWLEHNVLVLRGQDLTAAQFLEFGRRFGRPKPQGAPSKRHAEHPEITVMRNSTGTGAAARAPAQSWHTDGPWDADVCKATQLYAVDVPSSGGDTRIASMYAAYEALPESLRRRIEGLRAEFAFGARHGETYDLLAPGGAHTAAVHPIVRVHRESGRRALYVNPIHIVRVDGLTHAGSEQLIEDLLSFMLQPGAEYRHAWEPGDLVVWDNRSSIHANAGGHRPSERRTNWRVTIMEDPAEDALGRAA